MDLADLTLIVRPPGRPAQTRAFTAAEQAEAHAYANRLPSDLRDRQVFVIDPMLATGGTLIATIDMLKRAGARRIKGIFLVAAPEGLAALEAAHPDIEVYVATIDRGLNEHGYIVPGLGDAGDRLYGIAG